MQIFVFIYFTNSGDIWNSQRAKVEASWGHSRPFNTRLTRLGHQMRLACVELGKAVRFEVSLQVTVVPGRWKQGRSEVKGIPDFTALHPAGRHRAKGQRHRREGEKVFPLHDPRAEKGPAEFGLCSNQRQEVEAAFCLGLHHAQSAACQRDSAADRK